MWGRFGPRGAGLVRVGAELGLSGVVTGIHYTLAARTRAAWGRFGPGAGSGLGPVRAEWGWGGVGHALTLRLATRIGQVGPSRAG